MASRSLAKECGVCNEEYDEEKRCPRILPCTHCICTDCIGQLIRVCANICPFCRQGFEAKSAKEFRKNNSTLDLLQYLNELESNPTFSARGSLVSANRSKRIDDFKKENEEINNEYLVSCQRAEDQIESAIQSNNQLKDGILQHNRKIRNEILGEILAKISEKAVNNERKMEYLKDENKRLESQLKDIKRKQNKMKTVKERLDAAKTFREAASIMDEAEETNTAVQTWLQEFKTLISRDEETRREIGKIVQKSDDNMNIIQNVLLSLEEGEENIKFIPMMGAMTINEEIPRQLTIALRAEGNMSIIQEGNKITPDKVEKDIKLIPIVGDLESPTRITITRKSEGNLDIIQEVLLAPNEGKENIKLIPILGNFETSTQITHESLREMSDPVKRLVEQGRIFAVQQYNGKMRCARISISNYKLCLHYLQEEAPPHNVHILEHHKVMELVNTSSRLTFLELSANGKPLGRLYIRHTPNTKGAKHFSFICTGVMGSSYANTILLGVANKGSDKWESVQAGDYEFNDGSGGMGVMLGLKEEKGRGEYKRPWLAGAVLGRWGWKGNGKAAQFLIHTRDNQSEVCHSAIGIVEDGLGILTEAILHYPKINDVVISDCGIVLSS